MSDILAENLIIQRAQVLLLGVLAGLALLLSAVGIYGLVSNLVVQRTREIGIRLALGAQMRQVMMEVGKAGVVASGVGLPWDWCWRYFPCGCCRVSCMGCVCMIR